jgi:hypothetical protein
MDVYGALLLWLLPGVNLLNLLFTILLGIEQVETGWGYGTNWEMAVLYPWSVELLCLPVVLAGLIFAVLFIFLKSDRTLGRINLILTAALLLQYGLTNLFIWF